MAKSKKSGLERIPGYVRPMRPKERVVLPLNSYCDAQDAIDDILDNFDEDQAVRTTRWRKNESDRAAESERRRMSKKKPEEQ